MGFNRFLQRHNTGTIGRGDNNQIGRSGGELSRGQGAQNDPAYQLPEPQADPYTTDPAEWDYKTAKVGMNGEPLPEGAVGWRPNGEAYYGDGVKGWWNGAASRTKQAWSEGYRSGSLWDIETNTTWQAGFTGSVNAAKQVASEALFGVLNLVGQAAILTEQVAGTVGYIGRDLLAGEKVDLKTNWESSRLAYNEAIQSVLPMIETRANIYQKEGILKYVDLGGYMASKLMENDAFVNMAKKGDGIRKEFETRMVNGENPELIAEDLQLRGEASPWIEMGGQLIFDPLNAADPVAKTPRAIQTAEMVRDTFTVAESGKVADFLNDAKNLAKTGVS